MCGMPVDIDDDFIRKLFDIMNAKYPQYDFGFNLEGFDIDIDIIPENKVGKKLHRIITISVIEDDIEGIKEAIRILKELLPAKIELEDNNSTAFDESFTQDWE